MALSTRFITGIRWHKGTLEMLNNMTFIYDPNWKINNSVKPTFPVCFFHVKSQHEALTSEVSQKQMLFYNSDVEASSSDPLASKDPAQDSGLLNVVADNIVIKPKTYKLDVVIPYHNLTLLDQSFVYNTFTAQAITSILMTKKLEIGNNNLYPDTMAKEKALINGVKEKLSGVDKAIGSFATLSQPYFKLIKTLITTLLSGNYASRQGFMDEWIGNTVQQPDFNKESLETMWRMRHILKMKVWNSWQYKYVAIVDCDITKEGTEDGVYEATLTLQEMPIVTMYARQNRNSNLPVFERKNELLQKRGDIAINVLDYASGFLGNSRNSINKETTL